VLLGSAGGGEGSEGLLVYSDIDPPRTHALLAVSRLIPEDWDVDVDQVTLISLTRWAVESRYPTADEPTAEEANLAVASASKIVQMVKSRLAGRMQAES
jgi:HEPN domain-containing protein